MKKKIIHTLVYTYEIPVSLEEHLICLKPRSNGFQELSNFELTITPSSFGSSNSLSDQITGTESGIAFIDVISNPFLSVV